MTGTESRTPLRLRLLLVVVYAAAATALLSAALRLGEVPGATQAGIAAALLLTVERCAFAVALGRSKGVLDWLESVVLIGLVLLPWTWLVLLFAVLLTAVEASRKSKLMQGSFNVAA